MRAGPRGQSRRASCEPARMEQRELQPAGRRRRRASARRMGRPRPGRPRRATRGRQKIAEAEAPADHAAGPQAGRSARLARRWRRRSARCDDEARGEGRERRRRAPWRGRRARRRGSARRSRAPTRGAMITVASDRDPRLPASRLPAAHRCRGVRRRTLRRCLRPARAGAAAPTGGERRGPRWMRRRLTRRGSASRISNSSSPGTGDDLAARPARGRPASRSGRRACRHPPPSSAASTRSTPMAAETSSRSARASAMKTPSGRRWNELALGLVVLVLDVADDDLDDVLDRDQAVGAAIFVDHQGQVRARRLHLDEQVDRRHRGRHEQHRAQDLGAGQRRRESDLGGRVSRRARRMPSDGSGLRVLVSAALAAAASRGAASAREAIQSTKSRMWTMPRGSSRVSP